MSMLTMIDGEAGKIEVDILEPRDPISRFVAVVCHPHPLAGGTMSNKVVTTLARMYRDQGIPTVRFNFRGVGQSEGVFDNTIGEVADLRSVVAYVASRWPQAQLLLAGFSFGAYIAYAYSLTTPPRQLITVAPAVNKYVFDTTMRPDCEWIVVVAGEDEIVPADAIRDLVKSYVHPPLLLEFPEASHFFHGQLIDMRDALIPLLQAQLS